MLRAKVEHGHACMDESCRGSAGGFLSNNLGCQMGERFAGISTDAGLVAKHTLRTCVEPGQPAVPAISFHSSADPTVPIDGSIAWASQSEVDAMWRSRNGCGPNDTPTVTLNTSTTVCRRWACADAPVEACVVSGLDHCWIGGRSGGFPTCVPRPGDVDVRQRRHRFGTVLALFWDCFARLPRYRCHLHARSPACAPKSRAD